MIIFVTILHVIMCLILIAMVLFQQGKGASMGAAFGGGSNTLFGAAGPAGFLNKLTTVAAVAFMVTSFTLALLATQQKTSSSVIDEATRTQQEQPVAPTAATPAVTAEQPAAEATAPATPAATQTVAPEATAEQPADATTPTTSEATPSAQEEQPTSQTTPNP